MAFCSKCGTQIDDNVAFCPSCGAANASAKVAEEKLETPKAAPEKNKKSAKNLGIIIGVIVALVVLAVLCISVFGGGAKKPIKKAVNVMNAASTDLSDYFGAADKLYSNLIADALDLTGDIDKGIKSDFDEAMVDALKEAYEALEDTYGEGIKITYEIDDEDEMDEDELEYLQDSFVEIAENIEDEELSDADELQDLLDDWMELYGMEDALEDILTKKNVKKIAKLFKSVQKDYSKVEVSEGYIITVDVKIEGEDDDEKFKDIELVVVKVNGKWGMEKSSLLDFYDTVIGFDFESTSDDIISSIMDDLKN